MVLGVSVPGFRGGVGPSRGGPRFGRGFVLTEERLNGVVESWGFRTPTEDPRSTRDPCPPEEGLRSDFRE